MAFKMDMLLTLMLVSVPMQFARAMTWSSCAESPFSPSKVTLKPDPPVSGQDVTFTISGDYVPQGMSSPSPGGRERVQQACMSADQAVPASAMPCPLRVRASAVWRQGYASSAQSQCAHLVWQNVTHAAESVPFSASSAPQPMFILLLRFPRLYLVRRAYDLAQRCTAAQGLFALALLCRPGSRWEHCCHIAVRLVCAACATDAMHVHFATCCQSSYIWKKVLVMRRALVPTGPIANSLMLCCRGKDDSAGRVECCCAVYGHAHIRNNLGLVRQD